MNLNMTPDDSGKILLPGVASLKEIKPGHFTNRPNVPVWSANQVLEIERRRDSALMVVEPYLRIPSKIESLIENYWVAAKDFKNQHITPRLISCARQVAGEYEPDIEAEIEQMGAPKIFVMMTDVKCHTAASWLQDVLIAPGERPFLLEPTKIPSIPKAKMAEINREVYEEYYQLIKQRLMAGQTMPPMQAQEKGMEVEEMNRRNQTLKHIKKAAAQAAKDMEDELEDRMQEGNFYEALADTIDDFVHYPTAFFMGPALRNQNRVVWEEGKIGVQKLPGFEWECVSPYDIYPAPNAKDLQRTYFFHLREFTRTELASCKGLKYFRDSVIDEILEEAAFEITSGSDEDMILHDTEREALESRSSTNSPDKTITVKIFWGSLPGRLLKEDGLKVKNVNEDYEVIAWICRDRIIMIQQNNRPLGRRPYYEVQYRKVNNSVWGKALPEIMRDCQRIVNALTRDMVYNCAMASGPQVALEQSRLHMPEGQLSIIPWKIWLLKKDVMEQAMGQGNEDPIKFFQPQLIAEALDRIIQNWIRRGDDVTGIPGYIVGGDSGIGAVGKTASGMNQLMQNASKVLKSLLFSMDKKIIKRSVEDLYLLLLFSGIYDDMAVDCKIVCRGTQFIIDQQSIQMRRTEALPNLLNPAFLPILGTSGLTELLRDTLKGLKFDVDKIFPDDMDEIEKQVEQSTAQKQLIQTLFPSLVSELKRMGIDPDILLSSGGGERPQATAGAPGAMPPGSSPVPVSATATNQGGEPAGGVEANAVNNQ